MRILLFYDNFVRDYRGLLLLSKILQTKNHRVWLYALWDSAIEMIDLIKPDTVVMGQIGEFTTAKIGKHATAKGIHLVLNTTENIYYSERVENIFRVNFGELNGSMIAFQVITNCDLRDYVFSNPEIIEKQKYKHIGFPKLDLTIYPGLRFVESEIIQKKYRLASAQRTFLYISSFIFDDTCDQVSIENKDDFNVDELFGREKRLKEQHCRILNEFLNHYLGPNDILLIKTHPWDKSNYFQTVFKSKQCMVLDPSECITPILTVSDYVIHAESTCAIEAWILNKKTISVLPDFDGNRETLRNHMRDEVIVKSYSELISVIEHYPKNIFEKDLSRHEPLDGKATIRLANEISKLSCSQKKRSWWNEGINTVRLIRFTWKRARALKHSGKFVLSESKTYTEHFIDLERSKSTIKRMYSKAIGRYIEQNQDLID